ncbi:MAG: porin, partial [Pirellulales bacterium]|nr:porin [Pirellulales bacterium]
MPQHTITVVLISSAFALAMSNGEIACAQSEPVWQQTDPTDHDDSDSQAWTLFGDRCPTWNVAGWVSGGLTMNDHGNRTGIGNAPLPLNDVADGAIMNQMWLYAERPMDLDCYVYDWGFRIDYVFGVDAPDSQADGDQGWDFGWKTSRDYGSAIPQLYFELGTGDLEVSFGYFFSDQGYEYTESADNFFYSHSYAFGYGTPGTQSGFMIDYKVNEQWSFNAGWSLGWDSWWSNYLNASTALAGVTWTISEGTNIDYQMSAGDFGDGTAKNGASSNGGDIYSHSIILQSELSQSTTLVVENTLGINKGGGVMENEWYSLSAYL